MDGSPEIPLSIFGGVIGVLAGFRNTSAYARWWEARIIWGSIVNNSRVSGERSSHDHRLRVWRRNRS